MLSVSKKDVETDKHAKHHSTKTRSSGSSSTRIRANKLLSKAKQFTTKPVSKKYPAAISGVQPDTIPVETPTSKADEVHVETDDVSTDEYEPPELPVATCNTTAPSVSTDSERPKKKQGKVHIKSYVLKKKNKEPRTVYCKLCDFSGAGVRALNEHHRSDHGIQFCPDCNKGFNTQTSLDKHSYVHGENKFICDICGKAFQFSSRLEQHKLIHKDTRLFCMKPDLW